MRQLRIGSRLIGDGQPCFLIAEAGANHDGKFEDAIGLIDAAARAGADSIKFQHYTAGKLVSKDAMRYWLLRGEKYGSQFQPGSYSEDQRGTFAKIDGFPREKDEELMRHSESRGISMFSTPFDFESVDHLANLNVPAFKIAGAVGTQISVPSPNGTCVFVAPWMYHRARSARSSVSGMVSEYAVNAGRSEAFAGNARAAVMS